MVAVTSAECELGIPPGANNNPRFHFFVLMYSIGTFSKPEINQAASAVISI
jgi:hypothetical protein